MYILEAVVLIIVAVMVMGIIDLFLKSRKEKVSLAELNNQVKLFGEESAKLYEKQVTQLECLTDDYKAQKDKSIAFFKETEKLLEDMEAVSSKILNANHLMMNRLQVVENILSENKISLSNSDIMWLMKSFSSEIQENSILLKKNQANITLKFGTFFNDYTHEEIPVINEDIPEEAPLLQEPQPIQDKKHAHNDQDWGQKR
ncbi:MAG: hypothetical protein RSF33_09195 [Hydrogenoanaerobacterium sp.]